MIQEGSGQLNKTRYTACSLTSLCGKSKLFRGLMLFTVSAHEYFVESVIAKFEIQLEIKHLADYSCSHTLQLGKTYMLIQVFSVFV